MHAFLIIGTNDAQLTTDNLAKKLGAKILEFPLTKIEDVRNLNNLVELSFKEPTLIVSPNIHETTEEAINALLKNLEEPQENVYFALTAPSIKKVLPTVVSRCQIITINNSQLTINNKEEVEKFLEMTTGEKLAYVDAVHDRQKALELAENTVLLLHSKLHEKDVKYTKLAKNIESASKLVTCLKANGNVNLHLANFVINYLN